ARNLDAVRSIRDTIVEDRPNDAIFLETAQITLELGEPVPPIGTASEVVVVEVQVTVTALAVLEETLDDLARFVLAGDGTGQFVTGSVTASEAGSQNFNPELGILETRFLLRGEFARGITAD